MRDISIDCESLGLDFDAPVIAIGAQMFDRDTGKLGATFHQNIELKSSLESGRLSPDTLQWWMRQSDAARQVFQDTTVERYHIATVLQQLTTWIRAINGARVYARGPQEDITWLQHKYVTACVGLKPGWHYQNVFDMRTIVDMAQFDESTVKFVGTAHNALSDATYQAHVISACYQKINAALKGKPAPKPVVEEEEL